MFRNIRKNKWTWKLSQFDYCFITGHWTGYTGEGLMYIKNFFRNISAYRHRTVYHHCQVREPHRWKGKWPRMQEVVITVHTVWDCWRMAGECYQHKLYSLMKSGSVRTEIPLEIIEHLIWVGRFSYKKISNNVCFGITRIWNEWTINVKQCSSYGSRQAETRGFFK